MILPTTFQDSVDALLLDAWSSQSLGGTGKRIPIELLNKINYKIPWWLAGGISTEYIEEILSKIQPFGVDASSRLEISPGIKDIKKVSSLIKAVKENNV